MADRYRKTGGLTPAVFNYSGTDSNGSPYPWYSSSYANSAGSIREMWDHTDGQFYRRQRSGVLTIRPMTKSYDICDPSSGSDMVASTQNKSSNFGNGAVLRHCVGPLTARYISDSNALTEASVKARGGVVPATTLSAVSAYELRKTVDMFANMGRRASRFMKHVVHENGKRNRKRRRLGKELESYADTASSLWLEYRYGWVPLMFDIKGHIDAFNRQTLPWRLSRGTSSDSATYNTSGSWSYNAFGGQSGFTWTESHKQSVKVRCGIYFVDEVSYEQRVASNLGLDLWSTPQIMWEIVPFSFVVDWFINVGDWLQAIKPQPGVRWLGSWTSVELHTVATRDISGQINTGQCTSIWTASSQLHDRYRKVRYPSVDFPTHPPLGTGFNVIRSISAAALTFQQLKRFISR